MRCLPSWSKNILAIYYHFLISVQYDTSKLYKQKIGMARIKAGNIFTMDICLICPIRNPVATTIIPLHAVKSRIIYGIAMYATIVPKSAPKITGVDKSKRDFVR